jgi:hypothetical protein
MTRHFDISFDDFNNSTRRGPGMRMHETVQVRDDVDGGVFVRGIFGCGKTCPDERTAIKAYLGGRDLIFFGERG